MRREGRAAIAQFVQRGKEELVMIRPVGDDKLMLHVLYYSDEVRAFEDVPSTKRASGKELDLAPEVVEELKSRDTYAQSLEAPLPGTDGPRRVEDRTLLYEEYIQLWEEEQELRAEEASADDLPRIQLNTERGVIIVELFVFVFLIELISIWLRRRLV
jgi:hypothetical protein